MTLPFERTRSVMNAREFLVRLGNPYVPGGIKRVPSEVRKEARAYLRHFPTSVDLHMCKAPDVFSDPLGEGDGGDK